MTTLKSTMGFLIGILFLFISCNNTETEIKPVRQKIIAKYTNGNIYCEGTYLVNNNLPSSKVGIWKHYYLNGALKSIWEYDEKGDFINGKLYLLDGTLIHSVIKIDNIYYSKSYSDDGKLNEEYIHRTETEYDGDGNFENETFYKTEKTYHPNNQLKTFDYYIDGEQEGLANRWDENGNLILSIEYKNGFIVTDSIN